MEEDSITKFKTKHVPGTKGLINTFKKSFSSEMVTLTLPIMYLFTASQCPTA